MAALRSGFGQFPVENLKKLNKTMLKLFNDAIRNKEIKNKINTLKNLIDDCHDLDLQRNIFLILGNGVSYYDRIKNEKNMIEPAALPPLYNMLNEVNLMLGPTNIENKKAYRI